MEHVARRRWLRRGIIAICAAALYPVFVLASVYAATSQSNLPGGRHGPRDAYRHSLASATVAYTGSPRWVAWVTACMENGGRGDAAHAMDAHNNLLGARIGVGAKSLADMRASVLIAVNAGGVDSQDENRITWLSPERWQEREY